MRTMCLCAGWFAHRGGSMFGRPRKLSRTRRADAAIRSSGDRPFLEGRLRRPACRR